SVSIDRERRAYGGRIEEANARGIVGSGFSVAHTRLTYADRADAGHHLALGQMAGADGAGSSIVGLERRMSDRKLGYLGLDRLRQEVAHPTVQDFADPT